MPPERDLFANFERMRREMDELFGDVLGRTPLARRRGFSPRVDVYYEGDPPRAVITADLPGVEIEQVEIEVRGRELTIAGERRAEEAEGRAYQQLEIERGPFRREVELGTEVDAERASASYDEGVLRIEIPLARVTEEARRVPIQQPPEGGTHGARDAS